MKEYLDEISLFNHINEQNNQENSIPIDKETNDKFLEYDDDRVDTKKPSKLLKNNLKKCKRISQKNIQEILNTDNNNLRELNKEFIQPHLEKFELEDYKWMKFGNITQQTKEMLNSLARQFEENFDQNEA
jgi:hypothetical protein